jgi:tetratricopeptide (TPR) repeat protein
MRIMLSMPSRLAFVGALGVAVLSLPEGLHAQSPAVRAEGGGLAIGGSVSGSTINVGVSPAVLQALIRQHADYSETQKKLFVELEAKLDLNQRQIRAAFDILGERDVPPERLAAKLVEIAERFKTLQTTATAQPGDDSKVIGLKAEAQTSIKAGDLAKADALLGEVEIEQRRLLERLVVNAAETSARRGDIALTRLRYREAARHFANAARGLSTEVAHRNKHVEYLRKEAYALYLQGDEFGDNDALAAAIAGYKPLLDVVPRERMPLDWAAIHNDNGVALWALGERENDGGAAQRGGRVVSPGPGGKDTRARSAAMGRHPEQYWHCAGGARRTRERHSAAQRGGPSLSPGVGGANT